VYPELQVKGLKEHAQIRCESRDDPTWTKDNNSIEAQDLQIHEGGRRLIIKNTQPPHDGVYTCSGTSYAGKSFQAHSNLIVGMC